MPTLSIAKREIVSEHSKKWLIEFKSRVNTWIKDKNLSLQLSGFLQFDSLNCTHSNYIYYYGILQFLPQLQIYFQNTQDGTC